MEKQDLIDLKKKISELSELEEKQRNVYLRNLANGKIQGPPIGYPSIDKPWLKYFPEEAIWDKFPKMNMWEYLYESNKNNLNDIAIVFDTGFSETKITYKELFKNIDLVAKNLQSRGISKGDKVAVSFVNIPESAYVMYALNKIGAVVCLIDPRSKEFGLERDLKDLNTKAFIGISETYKKIKKVSKNVNLNNIIMVPTINSSNKKIAKILYSCSKLKEGNYTFNYDESWSKLLSGENDVEELNATPYKEDTLAVISYTGGTTGVHKGVKLSNDSLNRIVFTHKYLMDFMERGDIFMNILPQFMIYGIFTLHLGLCWGLETHMVMDPSPEKFVDYLLKINPHMCFGGPVHWETLIDNKKLEDNSLSNMKAPVSGGEKLPASQERKITQALLKSGSKHGICNGFGASELGGSVSINYGYASKEGSVGRLHVYNNAKIVNMAADEELTYDEVGELFISTPYMMLGYYNNIEEERKALITDEFGVKWFKTGDIAKIDRNGFIDITGRSKRLFVCGLNNVYPPEMEEIINTIPNVKKCAVVNVPDDELREVPKAHIVLAEDTDDNRKIVTDAIISYISSRISEEVIPRYFEFESELEYTPNGKIDFDAIRKRDLVAMKKSNKTLSKK